MAGGIWKNARGKGGIVVGERCRGVSVTVMEEM